MKRQPFALIVICTILLTACGAGVSTPPTATLVPTLPPTATQPPTFTSTPEPTLTPTATPTPRLPVSLGTQLPSSGTSLSVDNLDQVVELARWGQGVITDAAYSPDGKLIAIATTLGVSLYQADTWEETLSFETGASVNSLTFSSDGKTIATGLNDNTVKLWNSLDGALLRSLDGHTDENAKKDAEKADVTSVSFSPDGSLLAGGSTDGTVSLWHVADGSLANTLKHHTRKVTSVFFSADGQAIFSASWDSKVQMAQVSDGKPIRKFSGTGSGSIIDAVLSVDGKILAGYDDQYGKLYLWSVEDTIKITTIQARSDQSYTEISSIALSPDGQYVAAAYEDHTAKIWSVPAGVAQNTFEDLRPEDGWYYLADFRLAFSQDSQSLLLAGGDMMGIWDLKKNNLLNSSRIKNSFYDDIALSPDAKTLAAVEGPNVILIHVTDGNLLSTQDQMQSNGSLAFSRDGTTLLVSMFDNTARLWPLSDQGIKKSFETEKKEYIRAVAYSPDGQIVALEETYTGKVELRQVSDGALIKSMQIGTSYGLGSLRFSSDGKYLAAALGDQIRLFQVEDGKAVKLFKGGWGIAFSPDGTLLAGGGEKRTLSVWSIPDGKAVLELKDRPDAIHAVTFSSDGKLLVAGYADGTIEVFHASDGTLLRSWKGHSELVSDLLFTSDDKYLISASYDGTIRMWGLKP